MYEENWVTRMKLFFLNFVMSMVILIRGISNHQIQFLSLSYWFHIDNDFKGYKFLLMMINVILKKIFYI